jgi:hypothetical protein
MRRGGALRIRASLINDLALTVELDLSHLLSFLEPVMNFWDGKLWE